MQHNDTTITFTGQQLAAVEIVLIVAIMVLVCVALYSTWPRWSWEKR